MVARFGGGVNMLNVIYGKNASGKTKVLFDMYTNCSRRDSLTNMVKSAKFSSMSYVPERVALINELIDFTEVKVNSLGALTADELSSDMLQILELIAKDSNNVFLDEPDFGLSRGESGILANILENFSDIISNFWVVTHSKYLYVDKQPNIKYWNVKEVDRNKFKLEEVSI